VQFEYTQINTARISLDAVGGSSFLAGASLAQSLAAKDLVHVFILSDGINVNGSDLAKGLLAHLPENVGVTGGLAGTATVSTKPWCYMAAYTLKKILFPL